MNSVIFVADFFKKDLLGGGESNDNVLINHLLSNGYKVDCKRCTEITSRDFGKNKLFIISNFVSLTEDNKQNLKNENYIIYEHDHKYVKTRDPSKYKNFLATEKNIVNSSFYHNAYAVVVLSKICKEVIEKNLNIENVYNIGCSLWSEEKFNYLSTLTSAKKKNKFVVLNSSNPTKNTNEAINFCKKNNIDFDLLDPCDERKLLQELSKYQGLVFLPSVLETFSRISAEAKMLNCKLLTKPKLLGFASEKDIFTLNGEKLIEQLKLRNKKALQLFLKLLSEMKVNNDE